MSGLELQQELIGMKINLPTILITGHGDMQMAVAAMRLGAVDFIEMPFRDPNDKSDTPSFLASPTISKTMCMRFAPE